MVAQLEAQRDAAHAEIEKRATKTLTTLNGRALTAIGGLPFQDQIRAMLGRDNPGLAQRLRQHMEFGRTAPADNGRPPAPPARSATDWRVSPDRSLGSPGSHTGHTPTGGGGSVGGVSLQGAHYSPGRSAVVVPGSPTPHAAPTGGTGHDPLLGLGLGGGAALGAGVAGFRAYQAARAARAAEAPASRAGSLRSGATTRTIPQASGSVLRGTNTARTPASPTVSRGAGRGGATGAARPVSSSSSSSGSGKLLRGATTAQRAAAPKTPSRGPGMLKGAVTAPRKPTGSTEPVGKPGRAQTEPASSRTTGTNSRGAGANAKTGNTRGTGSNAKTAARGTTGSTGRTGAARAGAGRSGASSLAARPQTGKVSQQVRDGSTSQALHSLGRRTRDADRKKRDQAGGTDVTAYETDNTVTFLEAGHRTTTDDEDTAR